MMEYKGYHAAIKYDHEDEVFHGEVVGTRDVIFFEATSVDELKREFRFSIDEYLAMCEEWVKNLTGRSLVEFRSASRRRYIGRRQSPPELKVRASTRGSLKQSRLLHLGPGNMAVTKQLKVGMDTGSI